MDPWATEYGAALQTGEDFEQSDAEVDPFAETTQWEPTSPPPMAPPDSIVFVDGVQRVEARVLADVDDELAYGAFTSMAVGAVRAADQVTAVAEVHVERVLALATRGAAEPVAVPSGSAELTFLPYWSPKPGYLGVADAIDLRRRDLERQLGYAMDEAGESLVVVDGRLQLFPTPHTAVVGYAKTIHRQYLPPAQAAVLPELQAGQRSPVFTIEQQEPLYSWYVRLAPGRPIDHPLAGLVRLETLAAIGLDRAIHLAEQTASCLPGFASTPERDPRAPQNLLPIGGLELQLRHFMGDHTWVRRAIESYLYQTAA